MSQLLKKNCKNCGRPFFTREKDRLFCELRCQEFFKDGIKVCYRPESINVSFLNTNKRCKNCGKILEQRPKENKSNFELRKFCSVSCATTYRRNKKKK